MPSKNRIFLAHAREDKPQIRDLYKQLKDHGFDPWLDEIDLMPGQIWKEEIPKAILEAGVFLACLSERSVSKVGYVQSEFRRALSAFGERPPGSIFLIPVRLDECEVPDLQLPDLGRSLKDIQWVDLFVDGGLDRLLQAIEHALAGNRPSETGAPSVAPHGTKETTPSNGNAAMYERDSQKISVEDERSTLRADASTGRKWSPTIVAAIITAIAVVSAALLNSPVLDRFIGDGDQGVAVTDPIASVESKLQSPENTGTSQALNLPHSSVTTDEPRPVGEVFHDCEGCPEMVMLPPGKFVMNPWVYYDNPRHEVTISEPFAIGKYEVTFDEYRQFTEDTNHDYYHREEWGKGRQPIVGVSWNDAKAYCAWLGVQTGKNYRLPSEAEWEYAARAEATTPYAFGDKLTESQANFGHYEFKTVPVGAYPANGFGVHDMHGNVSEWVEDYHHDKYRDSAPTDGSAWSEPETYGYGFGVTELRVTRGVSWAHQPIVIEDTIAIRGAEEPNRSDDKTGIRCARDQG